MTQSKEKTGTKQARIEIPADLHKRIVKHQTKLIGERGEKLTFQDACLDLLSLATKPE